MNKKKFLCVTFFVQAVILILLYCYHSYPVLQNAWLTINKNSFSHKIDESSVKKPERFHTSVKITNFNDKPSKPRKESENFPTFIQRNDSIHSIVDSKDKPSMPSRNKIEHISTLDKIPDFTVETSKPDKKSEGFLASVAFWEQQTEGLLNFHHLQCVANQFGMRVVEPFLTGTKYNIYPSTNDAHNISTLFDMEVWNKQLATLHKYKPVLSWETLQKEAPKQVIIHCIQHRRSKPASKTTVDYKHSCSDRCYNAFDPVLKILKKEGFEVIERTCTNVTHYNSLNQKLELNEFKQNIFGGSDPSQVTVLFNEFRGIETKTDKEGQRLPLLLNSPCAQSRCLPPNVILPSARTLKDAEKYYSKRNKDKTIAVMARIERVMRKYRRHLNFPGCVHNITQTKEDLYKKYSLKETFLAMDVGKYGTSTYDNEQMETLGHTLFESLYSKQKWTYEEWEGMFSGISSCSNPAYVGNLQRTIAARATCLILIGGGSFQAQTKEWHRHFHPEQSKQCVHTLC